MEAKPALARPDGLEFIAFEKRDEMLTMTIASVQISPCCPLCGTPSTRVHSFYQRRVADLPCSGQQVRLLLHVRKCFCQVNTCQRKIFAERLTPFVTPWARVTLRLFQIVQTLGQVTGGRLGVRVTERLSIQTSKTTILRRIMALPTEPVGQVPQIGIDDFSFRRGRKFGSIVVDLQTHKVLDLLPDRTTESAASWMAKHPELEIVSRDRGGDYASAATQAAPQAVQVADRFRIFKNLSEAVELALTRCRAEIRKKAEDAASDQTDQQFQDIPEGTTEAVLPETWKPTPGANKERERLIRRDQRYDRYQQAVELQSKGLIRTEIAKLTGVSERTLRRWLNADTFPEARRRRKRPSEFDKYGPYVLHWWEDGCRNGTQLLQEVKALGYSGSYTSFSRFLKTLRERREEHPECMKPQKQQKMRPVCMPSYPLQNFIAHEAL
jgi:transposase